MEGKLYQGLTNIGYNPTFKDKTLSVETHIFDFSANIVKQNIKVNFLLRLRDEITFTTVEELFKKRLMPLVNAVEVTNSDYRVVDIIRQIIKSANESGA